MKKKVVAYHSLEVWYITLNRNTMSLTFLLTDKHVIGFYTLIDSRNMDKPRGDAVRLAIHYG